MGSRLSTSSGQKEEDLENVYIKRIMEAREKLTGMERLKLIFSVDQYSEFSPELQRVIHGVMLGTVLGAFVGAIGRGRIAHSNFLRSNAHERFSTSLEAKRKLQDTVTIGMFSGGFRIAWRVGLFTGIYLMVSTAVSTYRGKMAVLDQVAGAGAAGFLYKFPQGPKASISGAVRMAKLDEKESIRNARDRDLQHEINRDWQDDGLIRFHDKLLAEMSPSKPEEEELRKASLMTDQVQVNSESKSEVVNKSVVTNAT
ncbi:hypothetical protein Ocin01_14578 [Orchesella cincta]|uniref:Complex I assembly factor TIMMDC1, mitochondrial n=1 Tax=Orchesella cincta TaxID=48709 RepID=A0A1D2MGQ7_ORCCI|nr:hypothetical protein Ocin01_14578 [Orchesella cincta]